MMPKLLQEEAKFNSAYEEAVHKFGHRPYVTAIDVGPRYINGKKTDEVAVRIHVNEKKDKSALEASEIFPEEIRGVSIDVIQRQYAPENKLERVERPVHETTDRTTRQPVLRPGISIAHKDSTAGTLGMIVMDNKSKKAAILSNWHVLAGSANARPGDQIVQPGPYDGGKISTDVIASLERMILDKDGDAAIAILNTSRKYSTSVFETNNAIRQLAKAERGDLLVKSGRTTGVTKGEVEAAGTYYINYSTGRVGIEGFSIVPQDRTNPNDIEISMGGDSGSIWVHEESGSAVGLHFAGETNPLPGEEHAIACDISKVFERLDISILNESKKGEEAAPQASALNLLANELGDIVGNAVFEQLDGREIRRVAAAIAESYPRLSDSDEVTRILRETSAPEIGPFGAVAIGFAAGAAARLVGRSNESLQSSAVEAFPIVVSAFLAGAVAGARAVDGKL